MPHKVKYMDAKYIGAKYNLLTVEDAWLGNMYKRHRCTIWRCKCDCGGELTAPATSIANGFTKSCGCLSRQGLDKGREKRKYQPNQGYGERLYGIWNTMKQRCSNPNNNAYRYYGGKGVTVCEEWANNYEAFREWAYSHGYDDDAPLNKHTCTIDRINPFGNYEPDNCRWADAHTQSMNRRSNHGRETNTSEAD